MATSNIEADLIRDEGERLKPYHCTAGKLTIGIGRNLDDVGISHDEALYLLRNDIARAQAGLDAALPWWRSHPEPVQRALTNLAFNLGIHTLLDFKRTLAAIESGHYDLAAEHLLDSAYARQVGDRAVRVAALLRSALPK